MRKFSFIERLIAVCCILAIMLSFPWTPVSAAAETDVRVTASTNASVKQGNSAYCYVYIDSMESLSTLEVTVHYDPTVVQLTGSYNQVDALVYDSGSTESTLQYTYIFDGNGQNAKTQLFYFEYIVKKDAPVGQSYFDIVVGDAFDAAFNTLPVSGSRCSFRVAEAVTNLQCSIRGTSSVETAVNQEFTLTYRFSTTEIASGSVAIRFDPELFAVSEVIPGGFLTDKMTDINTTLSGAVYLSFLGAQYGSSDQLLSLRMKTLKNTAQLSPITVTVTDLYNLQLDPITCGGYTTPVRVTYDPTVDENAPYVFLEQTYDPEAQTVTVQVCLEENAHLGAGDFVLQFDTERLAYKSAVKGYNPTFFNINDKNIDEGLLKFSVISLTDISAAVTMLTATFDVLTPCESTATKLQISGSGLANHLTDPIVLNFTGCTVETAGHTAAVDAAVAPTCLETGLTEGSHCAVCEKVLVAQETVAALGHDEIPHEAKAPTCTEIGWEAYNTCSRCDYTTYQEIPANGHTFQKGVCVICGADQDPGKTWDVSTAADGSLMAKLYLNADGTYDLQLTGSGPMKSWGGQSSMPWYSYREKITGLRLPDGLTTIGDYAFNSFTALTEITLPESLESLGYMAFYQCTKLQQINFNAVAMNDMTEGNHVFSFCGQETNGITLRIGADVEKIPAYLFLPDTRDSYRPKLTAVEFEAGGNCLEIGRMAFYQCRDISRLQLPEGLQSIGYYAFGYCSGLESLTLPEGLMTIENYAFYACDALQEVELPGSLQSIGAAVFYSCDALRKVTVNEGVTAIAERAFYGCTALESLQLPEGLQTIGSSAFQDCSGLDELQLPKDLVTIGSSAFQFCSGISELQLQKGLVTIGEYAFYGCTGLTELTLPESLQTIGSYAFYNCTSLTKINYNAVNLTDLSGYNCVFSYAGQGGDGITVTVGSSVTKIPAYLFYPHSSSSYAPKIVAVEFAEGSNCQSIGSYAFSYCKTLKTLILPEGLQTIGSSAFQGCSGLRELQLQKGLVTIGEYAFCGCTGLTELTLPESLQSIGGAAFQNCTSLTKINCNAVNLADLGDGNWVFAYAGQNGDGITVSVGSSVTKIPAYLFYPHSNSDYTPKIVAVEFAEGSDCQSIGSYAFSYCKTLKTLILPEGLQTIGSSAFQGCTGLTELTLPENLQTIGNYAFYNCTSLTKINYNAVNLTDLSSYNYVFSYAGQGGDGIAVMVGSSVTKIPAYLFYPYYNSDYTPKIVAVEFAEGSNCRRIGDYAFYRNEQLIRVCIPASVEEIGAYAFSSCSNLVIALEADTLPATLGNNWKGSSAYILGVDRVILEANACYALLKNGSAVLTRYYGSEETYIIPDAVENAPVVGIHEKAFYGNTQLKAVQWPESLQTIGASAFSGCTDLESLTLPESLQTVGNSAFYGCTALTEIRLNAVQMADLAYNNGVFYNAGKAGEGITLTVGKQVTRIPAYLCYPGTGSDNTPKITRVVFEEGSVCQSIGSTAFTHNLSLQDARIPATVNRIEATAFGYCKNLILTFESDTLPETLGSDWAIDVTYYLGAPRVVTVGDARYTIVGEAYAILSRYNGKGETFRVEDQVEGIPVTVIDKNVFYGNTKLTAVTLPESLQTIGNGAFYGCTGLTELTLSESLQTIGSSAFYGCTGLTELTLPERLQTIGGSAFRGCTGLESLTLPENLQTIGNYAFYNCTSLTKINYNAVSLADLGDGNRVFFYAGQSGEGITVMVGSSVTKIPAYLFYPYSSSGYAPKIVAVEFAEGSACQSIGSYAFCYCKTLKTLILPESLQTIGDSAFYGCTGLTELTLPESLQTISYRAFYNCTSLTKINYNAVSLADLSSNNDIFSYAGQGGDGITVTVGGSATKIPAFLFYPYYNSDYTPKIVAVEFAEGSACQSIGSYAFYNCNGLTELTLPESLQTIGSYAFYNCTSLTKINYNAVSLADLRSDNSIFYYAGQGGDGIAVTVGSSVTKIPTYLFYPYGGSSSVPKIVAVEFAEGSACQSIGSYAFSYCKTLKTLILPESLQTIGGNAFYGCISLSSLQLPESLQTIGSSAFYGCTGLTELTLPEGLQTIGSGAFSGCIGLETLTLPESLQTIGDSAFSGCTGLKSLTLPEGLQTIGSYTFYNCTGLTELTLPENLQTIGNAAFHNCTSLTKINYNAISLADLSDYNYVFSYAGQGGDGITVTMGGSVTKIPAYLFYPYYNSDYTPKIVAVEFAEGSACQSIGSYAFYYCETLKTLILPEGLQTIGSFAFYGCTGLNSLHLPEGLQTIDYYAFGGCTGLETLTLPEGLQTIGSYAFYNCTSLTKINYNAISLADLSSNNDIFSYAGQGGDGITLTVGSSVTKIPAYLFYPYNNSDYAPKIVAVEFAEGSACQSIGQYAFYGCTDLKSLTLPESLQTIGNRAFYNCTSLTKINYNAVSLADLSSNNRIFSYAGQGGDGIAVMVGSGVTKLPAYLFYPYSSSGHAPKIVAVEFAESSACQSIGSYAFYNCNGITELTLPESLQTIGGSAFSGCTGLETLTLPESLQSIGSYAFYGCTGLNSLHLPEGLQTIGDYAFSGCTGLRKVMVLSSAVAEVLTSNSAAGYLTQYAQTVLLPGDTTINSYLQNKYANREQIIRDGVSYWLLDQNTHSWQETQTLIQRVPCQVDGLIRYTCEHCEIYKDVTVERHTIVEREAKAPDCETVGWDAYQTCAECAYTTYAEIPALGHWAWQKDTSGAVLYVGQNDASYPFTSDGDVFASTNKTDGTTSSYVITAEKNCTVTVFCKVSSETNFDKLILQHNGAEIAQLSGQLDWREYSLELEIGDTVRISYRKDGSVSTGQDTGWFRLEAEKQILVPAEEAEPTCLDAVVCSVCKKEIKAALGHDEIPHAAQAVTCLEIGWDAYVTCSRCEYTTYKEIPALGHDEISHAAQAVTCLEIGWDAYETCSRCDYSTYAEIPALGHDPISHEAKAPTCTAIGWEAYETCSRCDYSTYAELPVLGHDPVYSHTQQPTCLEVGYHVYACTRCDYTEKQEIAPLGHDPVSHEAKAPACTEIGWDTYETCSRCSYTTYKEIPANGHSYVETFCTVCGMKQTPLNTWDVSAAADGSLTAKLYKNYVNGGYELELEGSGAMKDYNYNAPWYSAGYCYSINRVSLPEGLTYIGACAFQYCSDLRQIRIPDSVEGISNNAFDYSDKLVIVMEGNNASLAPSYGWNGCGYYVDPQKVILEADATYVIDKDGHAVLAKYVGNGNEFVAREEIDGIPVTKIGRYAFYQKTNLKTYWIPEEINAIGANAFNGCSGLTLILESQQLPASLGSGWYGNCRYYLAPLRVWEENGLRLLLDRQEQVHLLRYVGDAKEVLIPAQFGDYPLKDIQAYAFQNTDVELVTIPDTIQVIESNTFYDCRSLTQVALPKDLTQIGNSAFEGCSSLLEIQLPESLTQIGTHAFWDCSSLKSVVIPDGITSLKGLFVNCYSLESVTIPDSVTTIEGMTFYCCYALKEVKLPKNLRSIGYACFYRCNAMRTLELPEQLHNAGWGSNIQYMQLDVLYIRSPQLAATVTEAVASDTMFQNLKTLVIPAGTGTDYIKSNFSYCETRMRDGAAVDVYSSCAHDWQTEQVSEYVQCESDGYEIHTCSLCGVWTDDFTPKHAMETTLFAPTCTEEGYTLHTCADCGATERTDPVNKLGHTRNYGGVLCNRCGEVACLLALKNGDSLFGCGSWQEAMNEAWRGNTLVLYGDITGDVRLYQTMRLDLNGHDIRGTLIVSGGATLYGVDSATDDFTGSYGSIAAINGNFLKDATSVDGKRYIALTDETGVSFHRLQLQLHTVSLRTSNAGIYYKASLVCDEALRSVIVRHGTALSVEKMPGADFKADGRYTWSDGAPTGDFTSGSVVNIFRSGLSAQENAARGEMKIYANAYLQLADGTVLMADTTTGDTVSSYGFDGIAWSLKDVLTALNREIDQPAYAEHRQQILSFCEAWKEAISGWQLDNLTQ